jgi:aspartyl-tRNA(Asn)/glutamyl-tRNA(Gln) amidotransferase subunit A
MSVSQSNPNSWTIAAARDALRKGEITAVDLTMSCLTAMDAGDALNAYVHKTPEIALEQARAADARLKADKEAPAMCGIPLGIKDLFCTKGVPSQAASNILKGFKPEYESTVTAKLFEAGAVMLGKLNMDEFAMGSSNESSCYGPAVSPWKIDDLQLTPGGSSGGSAAAVAADLCLAAQVINNARFAVDMSPYPTIQRIHDTCMALPSFEAAAPTKQPDAVSG